MKASLIDLTKMTYPGRVIIIGLSSEGDKVIVSYAITGRSPSSQARKLKLEGNAVWTRPLDVDLVKRGQVDLLLYKAIVLSRGIAVSNGRQTDDILRALEDKNEPQQVLGEALRAWTYEPDAPHFTPRISGCVLPGNKACLSIIKRRQDGTAQSIFSAWSLSPGKGKLIATYSGEEENPLPSFAGDPRDIETGEPTASAMASSVFEALKPANPERDYRVAIASVMASNTNFQEFDVHIINRKEG